MRTEAPPDALSFDLLPSLVAPADARNRLEPFRDRWSLERFQNVRLVITELVSNAVRHGPAGGPIAISVRADAQRLRGEVIDQGSGFDPSSGSDMTSGNGYGLLVVEALADRWGVNTGHPTTVWFEMDPVRPSQVDE